MKMCPGGDILEGGASEMRSWRIGAASPITKLIRVRPPYECLLPLTGGEHAGETGVSHALLAGCRERSTGYAGRVSALLWPGHPQEDDCGRCAADRRQRRRRDAPSVRAHLWDHDRRSVCARRLAEFPFGGARV